MKELLKILVCVCFTLLLLGLAELTVYAGLAEDTNRVMVIFLTAGLILQRLDFEDHVRRFREFGMRLIEACQADIAERFANKD